MDVIRQWLSNKINNKEIGIYLKETLSVMKIAIYGAGELGELLYDDIIGYLGFCILLIKMRIIYIMELMMLRF